MIRDEQGHEDLMKEAVSLIRRIECRCSEFVEPVLLGFNSLNWLFIYLGTDPMYRFDEQGRLRRAFVDGVLYRTEGKTLAMIDRQNKREPSDSESKQKSVLTRRDLSPPELAAFRERMTNELRQLSQGLEQSEILRQHPADGINLVEEFEQALATVFESKEFLAPQIVRRR